MQKRQMERDRKEVEITSVRMSEKMTRPMKFFTLGVRDLPAS